jgi:DNA (cytosine-5)-methyltransferase 1
MALHSDSLNIISLCTGGGGLDLGIELAMPDARSVVYVEREAFACAHLVSAMQQGLMDEAPIWSNARTFNGRPWRGIVDGLIGGIPCQPHSLAGLRQGEDDERDLWSTARRIIVQVRPWFVLIENVRGMLSSGGAERVWRDLHRMGFTVEGGLFTASEVGAPHERERIIILAVADSAIIGERESDNTERSIARGDARQDIGRGGVRSEPDDELANANISGLEGHRQSGECAGELPVGQSGGELDDTIHERRGTRRDHHGRDDGNEPFAASEFAVVNTARDGWREGRTEPKFRSGRSAVASPDDAMADANLSQFRRQPSARQQSLLQPHDGISGTNFRTGLFPPGPSDLSSWRHILERAPELEPAFRRVADGLASRLDIARVDRLRLLGNGVVSLQGAYAFRTLATRLAASGSIAAKRLVRGMVMTDSEIREAAE